MRTVLMMMLAAFALAPSPIPAKEPASKPHKAPNVYWTFFSTGTTIKVEDSSGSKQEVYLALISFEDDPDIVDVLNELKYRGYIPADATALAQVIPRLKPDFSGRVMALGSWQKDKSRIQYPYFDSAAGYEIRFRPLVIDHTWHYLGIKVIESPSSSELSSAKR